MVSCYTLHDWPHNLFIRLALGPSQKLYSSKVSWITLLLHGKFMLAGKSVFCHISDLIHPVSAGCLNQTEEKKQKYTAMMGKPNFWCFG